MKISNKNKKFSLGFTLVELMIVVSIIGVISFFGTIYGFQYLEEARLSKSFDRLWLIKDAQLARRMKFGSYLESFTEEDLQGILGVDLESVTDFCFVTYRGPDFGGTTDLVQSTMNGDAPVHFEVLAILRRNSNRITTDKQVSCTVSGPSKQSSTSYWVNEKNSQKSGREGQVVVLRYPPPPDGVREVNGIFHDWQGGISRYNALAEISQ